MDHERDPRLDPQPGDEILQAIGKLRLRVVLRDGDQVGWERRTQDGWQYDNTWSIRGWIGVVSKNAVIVSRAPNIKLSEGE